MHRLVTGLLLLAAAAEPRAAARQTSASPPAAVAAPAIESESLPPDEAQRPAVPAEALRAEAEQHYLDGDLVGALARYRELANLLAAPGEKIPVLVTVAWLEHLQGVGGARETLVEALRLDPDMPFEARNYEQAFVDLYLGARHQVLAERQGRVGDLLREAAADLGRHDLTSAERRLREALALEPDQPSALYNLALVELERGNADAAIAGFERVLSLAAATRPVSPELQASSLNNLAVLYYGKSFWIDAENAARRAVEIEPGEAHAWTNLGLSLRRQGKFDQAIEALRRAQALAPADEGNIVALALAYLDQQRWNDAVALLAARTRETAPAGPAVWFHLGLAQRGLGDSAGAANSFRQALELDPGNAAGADRAATFLALTEYELGNHGAATEAARRALAWRPEDVESWIYLGLAQQGLGDLAGARESLERARTLDPNRADLANNLGTVLFELGDLDGAEKAFGRALELQPGFPQATTNLANTRQAQAQAATLDAAAAGDGDRRPRSVGLRVTPVEGMGIKGLRVESVSPNSRAGAAGLRQGDLILLIDGAAVATQDDLDRAVAAAGGEALQLDILRDSRPLRVAIRLR